MPCSIQGCEREHKARGWCKMHYARWSKYGDPNKTVTAPTGEPANFYGNMVIAFDGDECLPWPYGTNGVGYGKLWLDGRVRYVHVLVCEHVNGPPPTPKHEAAHSCGKGHLGCVNPRHLSWKTRAENHADKLIHGTHLRGENHPSTKLTNSDARAIRSLRGSTTQREIALKFAVSEKTVNAIQMGRKWSWLGEATNA